MRGKQVGFVEAKVMTKAEFTLLFFSGLLIMVSKTCLEKDPLQKVLQSSV